MKQKVTYAHNESFATISQTLESMIENGAEIVQLVNAGTQFDWPDWVIIYKE